MSLYYLGNTEKMSEESLLLRSGSSHSACFLKSFLKNSTWKCFVSPADQIPSEYLLEYVKPFPCTLYFSSHVQADRRDGGL